MTEDRRLEAVAARYEAGAVLEQGPTWTFCRATERASGQAVVLRIVEDERLAQDANAQRFLAEAKLVRAVDQASLIPMLDAGASAGVAWVASATTTGTSLREVLARGPLPAEDVTRAGEQVAAALDAVHVKGVVHRDLRAEQVVQVAPGSFRLGGFGVGRWMMTGAVRSDGTPVAGLPAVLSPELVTGGAATAATDIHALGLLLFEMLTGRHPFAADASDEMLEKLVKSYALRPSALAPGTPAALEEVILRALSKDPASRFVTALAMQQALAVCPGGSGAPAAAPTRRRTMPTWAELLSASTLGQRIRRAALIVAPLVIVAGGAAYVLKNRAPARIEDPVAHAQAEIAKAPRDRSLRVQLGEQLERVGRVDDARRFYNDTLKLDPGYARAITGLARLQDREGRRDEARRTYRRAIEADPKAWYAVLELVRLLDHDARKNEATVLLQQGLAASPGQPDLTEELAKRR